MAELFDSLAGRTRFTHNYVQYLNEFSSGPEATSDITSGRFVRSIMRDYRVKFSDHRVNLSREIPPEADEAAFSTVFFAVASDRK